MANEIKYRTAIIAKSSLTAEAVLRLTALTSSRALILNASGEVEHSTTTDTELGYLSGVTSSVQTQLSNNSTAISDHLADASDAHDASAISSIPSGNLAASNVQSALNELQSDVDLRALTADVIKHNGTVAFSGDQSMGGFKLTNLSDPSVGTDAANASFVETSVDGLKTEVSTILGASVGVGHFGTWTAPTFGFFNLTANEDAKFLFQQIQDAIDEDKFNVDRIDTLIGSTGSDLGTFSGFTIADNVSVKTALQTLETSLESLDSSYLRIDGGNAMSGDLPMGGNKIVNMASPTVSSDGATKGYVDAVAEGLKPKAAVRVATTANITIASDLNAGDVIDGITLANGDRVLVKDQSSASQNGIYVVSATPARSTDFDSLSPIDEINGALVAVQEGTLNAGKVFVQSGSVAVLNTDPISFVFFNSSSTLVGGDGITVSGSNISVDHDGQGLQFVANQLALELDGSTLSKSASGLKLSDTAVSAGSYGSASQVGTFTVDAQGRLTAASNTSILITASQVSDFDEAAQDAVGGILVDSSSIDFTYTDGTPSITAVVLPAGVDHDALSNFVANEHVDHSSVVLSGAANGGISSTIGDITASRSISIDITNATAETVADNADLILVHDDSAGALRKMSRSNFLSGVGLQTGDIAPTSFTAAAGQTNQPVTGLAFANGVVRSFEAQVQIVIDATSDLFESYHLSGIQKGASWEMSQTSTGDDSGVTFSINSSGQILYSSTSPAGFVSSVIKFRATALSV